MFSDLERRLCKALCDHPENHTQRFETGARNDLLETLFRSLTNDRKDYLASIFPSGFPASYKLQDVQGAEQRAEYTVAARGHPCGHIFQQGEASYHCMTCADDATCALCARCFDSSDHEGHQVHISSSAGNSGCCDCGDLEAWKRPVNCAIHTASNSSTLTEAPGSVLPSDLQESIRTTISRTLDYFCDVISCSHENLRVPKTEEAIRHDEQISRLGEKYFSNDSETWPEYCMVLWNDEKHTVEEVKMQVTRACRARYRFGEIKANEAHHVGRSVVKHTYNLPELIRQAKIIEQIKLTVTIRSSRDTYREQMCGTIVEWLSDIAGCSIFGDGHILRRTICEEMLKQWRVGSEASRARVGQDGLDVHGNNEALASRRFQQSRLAWQHIHGVAAGGAQAVQVVIDADGDDDDEDEEITDAPDIEPAPVPALPNPTLPPRGILGTPVNAAPPRPRQSSPPQPTHRTQFDGTGDHDMETTGIVDEPMTDMPDNATGDGSTGSASGDGALMSELRDEPPTERDETGDDVDTEGDAEFIDVHEYMTNTEEEEAPRATQATAMNDGGMALSPTESEVGDSIFLPDERSHNFQHIPRTPNQLPKKAQQPSPYHWAVLPPDFASNRSSVPAHEDFSRNIRLDSMILFDLRLWKQTRIQLRDLYISTVINIPEFKRVLGLRFASLYTTLSQLYLVADREPDHSIMNLSLQMLTTPSITKEVIERGNFLTNLMAILYTFLTTRQVGHPRDVDPQATLAFETGSVTNRRLIHFFTDLRWYLASSYVQERVRSDRQYIMQWLDLAKLAQGICPNSRAVGEHVEYETDAWINASVLTREINKLCRQFAEAFQTTAKSRRTPVDEIGWAIYNTTCVTLMNSTGAERKRFDQGEIKQPTFFKTLQPFEFDPECHRVVDFVVERNAMSFHHPLHYTLSWLVEFGNDSHDALDSMVTAAQKTVDGLSKTSMQSAFTCGEDGLLALFDFPIRVCAWLAQMKAGIWVRNGLSLRHQMFQYTSVAYRDVGYHRDLVLLQTALVTCEPRRLLASMIDRFGLEQWIRGNFQSLPGYEDVQVIDLVEDFLSLLIGLMTERDALIPLEQDPYPHLHAIRKNIIHTLCFKPLTYSDLTARLTERVQDQEQFQGVLEELTTFRPPEGLHDFGLFELRPEFLSGLDPYNPNFTKNQRDEAETLYKKHASKETGKPADDVVLEPNLRDIQAGAYTSLPDVTQTPLFAQVICACLTFVQQAQTNDPNVPATRVETFLHVVLQLALIATLEDRSIGTEGSERPSFVHSVMHYGLHNEDGETVTGIRALHKISGNDAYSSTRGKIKNLLKHFMRQNGIEFNRVSANLQFPFGRLDTASPANLDEVEAKKTQALERKAKVMAQFQKQQQSFMDQQGMLDWGDDVDDDDDDHAQDLATAHGTRTWRSPSGVCIHCREECNESRLYGTFGMFIGSYSLRETKIDDPDLVREVLTAPADLDRARSYQRPFGISGENHEKVVRLTSDGRTLKIDRQGLGKGWPHGFTEQSLVSTGCGHIMHFSCFETYYASVGRRHSHQIARNQPERLSQREFVCPLCKAMGNVFLPIVCKSVELSYPAALRVEEPLDLFLGTKWPEYERLYAEGDPDIETFSFHHSRILSTLASGSLASMVRQITVARENLSLPLTEIEFRSATGPERPPPLDLASILARLLTTMSTAKLGRRLKKGFNTAAVTGHRMLLRVLANSITATETAHRGQGVQPSATPLTSISSQTLSHLQVLSTTTEVSSAMDSFITAHADQDAMNRVTKYQLYIMLFQDPIRDSDDTFVPPLLCSDPFTRLTELSMALGNLMDIPVHHILELCYTAEILRIIVAYCSTPTGLIPALDTMRTNGQNDVLSMDPGSRELGALMLTIRWLSEPDLVRQNDGTKLSPIAGGLTSDNISEAQAVAVFKLITSHALVFLRKAVILMHVSHRVDFPTLSDDEMDRPELERLTRLLNLPAIADIMRDLSSHSTKRNLMSLARGWLRHMVTSYYTRYAGRGADTQAPDLQLQCSPFQIRLLHPCRLELIGLPKHFDVLMEESHRRRCPTTGKEVVDPALCLFCGDIFCAQASCCTRDKRGGCNLHVEKCSTPIGLFLLIRKCHVLMLHLAPAPGASEGNERSLEVKRPSSNGSFFAAPYLTKHGETDSGLRSRYQLILNQHRYDKLLRDVWLMVNSSSTIWSAIARKLEGDVNAGGWGTL